MLTITAGSLPWAYFAIDELEDKGELVRSAETLVRHFYLMYTYTCVSLILKNIRTLFVTNITLQRVQFRPVSKNTPNFYWFFMFTTIDLLMRDFENFEKKFFSFCHAFLLTCGVKSKVLTQVHALIVPDRHYL